MPTLEDDVPQIFYKLAAYANLADTVSPEKVHAFLTVTPAQESFLPEVVSLIGDNNFRTLVTLLGGTTIRIPTADEILTLCTNMENM